VRSDLLGEPAGDRARPGADLETRPLEPDPAIAQLLDGARIEHRLESLEPLPLTWAAFGNAYSPGSFMSRLPSTSRVPAPMAPAAAMVFGVIAAGIPATCSQPGLRPTVGAALAMASPPRMLVRP